MSCFAELPANSFCQLGFWLTLKLATMSVPRRTIESKHIFIAYIGPASDASWRSRLCFKIRSW